MTNAEAAASLRRWIDAPHLPLTWPLDMGSAQHAKFVRYKNAHWDGPSLDHVRYKAFVLAYAAILEEALDDAR